MINESNNNRLKNSLANIQSSTAKQLRVQIVSSVGSFVNRTKKLARNMQSLTHCIFSLRVCDNII